MSGSRWSSIAFCSGVLALASCKRAPPPSPTPASSASPIASVALQRARDARTAENKRDPSGIGERDLTSSDPRLRRAAARALARIASEETRAGLLRLLPDEDAEVIAFAAYGLGYTCAGHEALHVGALVARAASLPAPQEHADLDPEMAVARALGRCASDDAETTLTAWLVGPRARAAALALGDLAGVRRLKDETVVALTVAVAGSSSQLSLGEALAPFARRDPPPSALARVREVATARLGVADETRILAIRSLGRTDGAAAPDLAKVLAGAGLYSPAERGEAARSLARLGERGQHALVDALPALLPGRDAVSMTALVGDGYGPLAAALDAVKSPPPAGSRQMLSEIATLRAPDKDAPPSLARRVIHLRCAAARALAEGAFDSPEVVGCDPSMGVAGELARLAVLGQRPITGTKRAAALQKLEASKNASVRAAVMELLGEHREIEEAPALVVSALSSGAAGTMAAAAEAITKTPALATEHPEVAAALKIALATPLAPDDGETRVALLAAVGAARLTALVPQARAACASPSPTLRQTATRVLDLLGAPTPCPRVPYAEPLAELAHVVPRTRLVFDTEAGELTLFADPTFAPAAATRLVELARSGFYDGMAIHRVVPGFVVQFGDKAGDGAGGCGRDALRCETSPLPFVPLTLGVALAGRDTGSSQFFVTLSRVPHLDGDYTILGTAEGDWAAVAEGDVIRKVTVRD